MPDLDYVIEQLVKLSEAFDRVSAAQTALLKAHAEEIERLWSEITELRDELSISRTADVVPFGGHFGGLPYGAKSKVEP